MVYGSCSLEISVYRRRITRQLRRGLAIGLVAALSTAAPQIARCVDTVKVVNGPAVFGQIKQVSPTEVTIQEAAGAKQIPLLDIVSIQFDSEPPDLILARSMAIRGDHAGALASLEKINVDQVPRLEIKQEVLFMRAAAAARMALESGSDTGAATKLLESFLSEHGRSYHALEANQLAGELAIAAKDYDRASKQFAALEAAPWPEMKAQARIAQGRALAAQDKSAEALAAFDGALALVKSATSPRAAALRQTSSLGKATCLAKSGKLDEAVQMIQGVIAEAEPEQADLHAEAYNVLGRCYRQKPGAAKEALLAFLHVDLLYSTSRQAHAEALANLVELWNEVGKPDRAAQARTALAQRYPSSPWAKSLEQAVKK